MLGPMSISRRDLLVYGAGMGAALPLIGNLPTARADGGDDEGGEGGGSYATEAERRFARYASAMQCARLAELPLLTGDNSVNGGIRFDDEMAVVTGSSKWRLQRAARVGDIEHRTNPGVLPMFTIGFVILGDTNGQTQAFTSLDAALQFLVQACGLPREGLSFTTTDAVAPIFNGNGSDAPPAFAVFGLDPSRVTYRPHAEALAAGDGSGWFFDPRNNVGFPTVSIEFTRGGLTLELGEVTRSGFAIGTERVQWAMTGAIPTWNQVLPTLLARIRAEAHRAHVQLPAGYGQFIWLGP